MDGMNINNNTNYDEIDKIKNGSDECKIEFISAIISQNGIPPGFMEICRSNADKIFYEIINGEKHERQWVLFLNNKFYCVYCVCFSPMNENRLVKGVDYVKNCRITEKLNSHGKELHHKAANNAYLKIIADCEKEKEAYQSGGRIALKCIVKIIIFIATHGENCSIAISYA